MGKVIDKIEYLTKKALELFIKKLQDVDINKLASNVRQQIFNALREKINRHRSFSDANWAMPEEILRVLDVAKQRFEPTDIIQKYMWLFVGFPELPEGRHDFEKSAEVVFEKRLQVLKEILEKEGINKIIEFSQSVEVPYAMGVVLGKSNLLGKEGHLVLELIASKKKSLADLAAGYAVGRFMSAGWEWVTGLGFKKWHYAQSGNLLIVLPFERKTWNLVESCGNKVIKHYWAAHSSDFYRGHDPQDVEYIVSNLLQHQRPFRAIDILSMAKHNKCEISPTLVMDVLEAALKLSKDVVAKQIKAHDRYEIQELFKFLQFATNVDEARLTSLEWSYLNLLDEHSGVTPKTLHKSIQSDPKFFAHLLSLVFRSKNEPRPPQNSITEQQKSVAQNAYKLLISLKSIPGTQTDGSVDEKQLTNWVIEARSLCKESGRLEVCDSRIGEMFAYAPKDVDKSWPCIAVRNVIEKIKSDKLDHGFGIGIFNKRGTHWKSQTDGGKEEHALSKQYSEYADHSALRWPRTAAVLRRMANNYERDARLEDEEAEARLN